MSDVLVVGCGLLGTSVGLALQGSELADVTLWDLDPEAVELAVRRGAGRAWDGSERASLALVAVPPLSTATQLINLQRRDVAQTYTHVASVQSHVEAEVEALSANPSVVVGGHPLAGREVSGPAGALSDLFVGRPWAVCPRQGADPTAVAAVVHLARMCGAVPVRVAPDEHDSAVALLSHLPHLLSAALAGLLVAPGPEGEHAPLLLSGPGLADTTRLAAGNPQLWTQILQANATHVLPSLRGLIEDLSLAGSLLETLAQAPSDRQQAASDALAAFLERGRAGRARVPVKRGEVAGAFVGVRVELRDEPGQLAALLSAAGEVGVNVEDLRVEHVPGRPRGVVELLVAPGAAAGLSNALGAAGWHLVLST